MRIVAHEITAPMAHRIAHSHMARATPLLSETDAPPEIPASDGITAITRSDAMRDTALFTAEPTPANRSSTAASTVAVSGATVNTSPSPKTITAGSTDVT